MNGLTLTLPFDRQNGKGGNTHSFTIERINEHGHTDKSLLRLIAKFPIFMI